jgi:cell division protein FtsB
VSGDELRDAIEMQELLALRAEHTFVKRLVGEQLLSRMSDLEADLAAERAEVERLRAKVDQMRTAIQMLEGLNRHLQRTGIFLHTSSEERDGGGLS